MKTSFERWVLPCACALLGSVAVACWPEREGADGTCVIESKSVVDCRVTGYTDELQDADLIGYSCTGTERPDIDAVMDEGVPEGLMCADMGPLDASGDASYCCTKDTTPCAYDPIAECQEGTYGYQCWGNNRPESLNPAINCTNGTLEGDLIKYCCSGRLEKSACEESAVAGCGDRLKGFLCKGDRRPRGEDLRQNQSRADYYYPTCSMPKQAPNPEYYTYCCYMPAEVQEGGTCMTQVDVPGCEAGRFGFACFGPDTPPDNFAPIDCPDPGFPGRTAEGWEATLYCCDFK